MSNYNIAYSEISYILSSLEEEYLKKIPEDLISFFRDNAEPHYIPKIDITKPLTNQNISRETEQLICLLNLNYWCTPKEREKLFKKYEINEEILQQQLKNKYEIKFNKNATIEDVKAIMVVKKDNIFTKIINFIKNLMKKKG